MQVTGSFHHMKSLNRSLVLNTIRLSPSISRSEIAKRTNLTPATVTNIVSELIKDQLVMESRAGLSSGGRKPILLEIRGNSRFIIGVDIGVRKIRLGLANLNGELRIKKVCPMPETIHERSFLDFLITEIKSFIDLDIEKKQYEKVMGIGIAMHGIVNTITGTAIHAPTLKLENIAVKETISTVFNLPVEVENDAKTLALGERWFGIGKDIDQFVSLNVGEGIGGGIVMDGKIVHGSDNLAGEIGHTVIDPLGEKCSCGQTGCLQTIASGTALRLRAQSAVKKKTKTSLSNIPIENLNGSHVFHEAEKGDQVSQELLEETGRAIGIGLVNIVHFINPELIILGGGVSKSFSYLEKPIKETLKNRALSTSAGETPIVVTSLGEYGSLIGACTLILARLFATESIQTS